MADQYDIIFAGGGTTACVTAGRLIASNPALKILVVESGRHSRDLPDIVQPCRAVQNVAEDSTTVARHKAKPSTSVNGRELVVTTGKTVGGGSAVNYMVYVRGAQSDYDGWANLGNVGWGFADLLPLIKKLETFTPIAVRPTHGYQGPIQASIGGLDLGIGRQLFGVLHRYDPQRPLVDDSNDFETPNAFSLSYKFIDFGVGKRSDAASQYLYPETSNPNLKILTESRVKRVTFDGGNATGIEYMTDGQLHTARATMLVVVSAGAFGSPSILERSGVGSRAILDRLRIPVVVDLPGVGENYKDHITDSLICYAPDGKDTMDDVWMDHEATKAHLREWTDTGKGKIATNGYEALGRIRPTPQELDELGPNFRPRWVSFFENKPDKSVAMVSLVAGLPRPGNVSPWKFITVPYYTLYTESTGRLHITSGEDPDAPLDFDTGFLSKPSDVALLNWLYKKVRELARRLPSYRGEVAAFHPNFPAGSPAAVRERDTPTPVDAPNIVYSPTDNAAIEQHHRNTVFTGYHSMGTCAMKPQDQGGVVNARLSVYGVNRLKVADLSICPTNVGNNTNSTALLIGEKAAVIIAEDLGLNLP